MCKKLWKVKKHQYALSSEAQHLLPNRHYNTEENCKEICIYLWLLSLSDLDFHIIMTIKLILASFFNLPLCTKEKLKNIHFFYFQLLLIQILYHLCEYGQL